MQDHKVLSRLEWLEARKQLLAKEKEFTRLRDKLSQERRELPWVQVEKAYTFDGPKGSETLADLFAGKSQLIVYHFMFAPEWPAGRKVCTFWADNFNGIVEHLKHRDASLVAISHAPLAKLQAHSKRLGWSFRWVSSGNTEFNYDYQVSFTPEQLASGTAIHNYTTINRTMSDHAGISVFYKDAAGRIFHTYSCYARGLDMMNGAYHYMDLLPKGRDEASLPNTIAWLRIRDEYQD